LGEVWLSLVSFACRRIEQATSYAIRTKRNGKIRHQNKYKQERITELSEGENKFGSTAFGALVEGAKEMATYRERQQGEGYTVTSLRPTQNVMKSFVCVCAYVAVRLCACVLFVNFGEAGHKNANTKH